MSMTKFKNKAKITQKFEFISEQFGRENSKQISKQFPKIVNFFVKIEIVSITNFGAKIQF